jgi:hypothetical protein
MCIENFSNSVKLLPNNVEDNTELSYTESSRNSSKEDNMIKEYANTGYFVSDTGVVYGKYKNSPARKTSLDRYGYEKIALCIDGKMKHTTVHRVVAETFIPNPENYKTVNHKDGNKLNNHVDNLEWCSSQQNTKHATENGLMAKGEQIGNSNYTEKQIRQVCEMIVDGYKNNDIAKATGVTRNVVQTVRSGQTWKHISCEYDFPHIAHQGISMSTFYWVCHKLQEGLKYKEILDRYTGGEYLTYGCLKKIKLRKMRPEFSKYFKF